MGGSDYYRILSVAKDADDAALRKAYRKLALKWHPDKNRDNKEVARRRFKDVAEAYEVLSDAAKRDAFDMHGEDGLRGPPSADGRPGALPVFSDPAKVFERFFGGGGGDTFSDFGKELPSAGVGFNFEQHFEAPQHGHQHGHHGHHDHTHPAQHQHHQHHKHEAEHPLHVSLEDLYNGAEVPVTITRKVETASGVWHTESKSLTVSVQPGWKRGTKITFQHEGDQHYGAAAADVVFSVADRPHPRFKRDGNDLVYVAEATLQEALCGTTLNVDTLDGRRLRVPLVEVISPGYTKVVPGEGMPISKHPSERGALVIKFHVLHPKHLAEPQKLLVRQALAEAPMRAAV